MSQGPGPGSGDLRTFEKSCAYCGARLRVLAVRVTEENRTRDYDCPECGKSYEIDAAAEPQVRVLVPRTDGKDDRYQETLF